MTRHVAACHVHSEWSYDASWTLPDLAAGFAKRGCDLILMTEHDRGWDQVRWERYQEACDAPSGSDILLVPGIEYSDPSNTIHVLVWGASDFLGEGLETSELLRRVQASGGVAVFAHPERRAAWKSFDPDWCEGLLGVEIWNRKTDGWAASSGGIRLWNSHPLHPFVGLDFHRSNQFFPLRMQIDAFKSEGVDDIYDALRQRNLAPLFRGRDVSSRFESGRGLALPAAERFRRIARLLKPR